jgi:hypothetical protein
LGAGSQFASFLAGRLVLEIKRHRSVVIIAAAGVIGQFTKVIEPPTMPAGLLYDVVYLPNMMRLVVVEAPIYSADFDLDGDVDGDDLTVWKSNVGPGDGADADFLAWQQQYGSVPAVPAVASVPEPAAVIMAFLSLATLIRAKRPAPLASCQ